LDEGEQVGGQQVRSIVDKGDEIVTAWTWHKENMTEMQVCKTTHMHYIMTQLHIIQDLELFHSKQLELWHFLLISYIVVLSKPALETIEKK